MWVRTGEERNSMKRIRFLLIAIARMIGGVAITVPASRLAAQEATPRLAVDFRRSRRRYRVNAVSPGVIVMPG